MKLKLLKPHRHAGINYSAGDVIDVDLTTSEYLANAKVATPVEGIVAPTVAPVMNGGKGKGQSQGQPNGQSSSFNRHGVSDTASTSTDTKVASVGAHQPTGDLPESI